jgi:hypothetical protein
MDIMGIRYDRDLYVTILVCVLFAISLWRNGKS